LKNGFLGQKYFSDQESIPRAYKSKKFEFLGTLEQYQPIEQHQSINEGETKNQKIKKSKNQKIKKIINFVFGGRFL